MKSIDKNEPVSPGFLNRLWSFLTRDLSEDRRPKHPRPELHAGFFGGLRSPKNTGAPRPKPPQPAPREGEGYRPRSSGDGPRCGPPKRSTARPLQKCSVCGRSEKVERAADGKLYCGDRPCRRKTNMETGRPFESGRDDLTEPSTPDCPHCEVGRVEEISKPDAFVIGRYRCRACEKDFTEEDIIKAERIKKGPPEKPDPPANININVAGFVGSEAELASQLSEVIKQASGSVDEIDSTGRVGSKTFVPRPPKVSSVEDRPRSRIEGEPIETDLRGGLRPNGQDAGNALLTATEEKNHDSIPTERGWSKRETESAPETSSAWWTAIKWIIGVGASIGIGWLIEWAVF